MNWTVKNKRGIKEWKDALKTKQADVGLEHMIGDYIPSDQKVCVIADVIGDDFVEISDEDGKFFILVPKNQADEIAFRLNVAVLAIEQASNWVGK